MTDHDHADCTHPPGVCSTTLLAGIWRMAAKHDGSVVLDPSTTLPLGDALDAMITTMYEATAASGRRVVGKPRVVVRTTATAMADERLVAITEPEPPVPGVVGVHTWLILTADRTCVPLESPC
jgi:hypothetical protein